MRKEAKRRRRKGLELINHSSGKSVLKCVAFDVFRKGGAVFDNMHQGECENIIPFLQ